MFSAEELYMKRCLELAKNGYGHVAPNPMVGCVIVADGKIIGEGYHKKYGQAHAEVNAINNVKDVSLLKNSTLYVNLEPCAHFGKTPPCSNLIIEKKIPRVVIGCIDTFSEVSGKGIEKMKLAGIDVKVGVLEKESIELNKAFFTFHNKKRPYVLLKWAQTLDGFIDVDRNGEINSDNWISNKFSKQMVHLLRSKIDGILVGKNTARNDNPSLTTRLVSGKSPTRLIIDFDASLPDNLIIFNGQTPTIVFTSKTKPNKTNLTYVKVQNRKSIISEILNYCFNNNIQTLMVEGGAQTLNLFIENNLWDEAHVFIGEKTFGTGIKAPQITKVKPKIFSFFNDKLLLYKNE
jgi:diaminohydroxyphosphoribosylaminopyrimidine deaminase/5-amino-6-(5-phosphoribosylamino)uracil reductase